MAKWLDKYEQGGLILKKKTKDNYGTKPNVNDVKVSAGPNFVGEGYTAYNWKSPAWGGQFQNGGSLWNTDKTAWVDSIHNARKGDLNFVQRFFDQSAGSIQIPGQRGRSTHFMESGDNKAYPTVVQMPNGKLQYLNQNDKNAAWNYANKTGQFIKFPTDEQAAWYADNGYKKGTGVLKKNQMGGSMPGAVGFMYARTQNPAPANGKYTKKTLASAQNGQEMKYWQDGLDFKPKSISKKGKKIIKDDRGQWAHPGEITEISSPDITMQGVDYPVLGISDTGDTQMMYPDQDYKFDGEKVTEFPMMEDGGWLDKYKAQDGKSLAPYGSLQGDLPEVVVTSTKPSKWGNMKFAPYDPSKNPESISQWNPKPGEREALAAAEKARRDEANSWYNNKHIKALRNSAFADWKPYALAGGVTALPAIGSALGLGSTSAAMSTPIAGVAGLTGSNIMNAAFAYQAAKNLPNVANSISTAYQNPTWSNVGNATLETGITALDALPFAASVTPGVKAAINASKESGLLSNAYKVNPFAFKPNSDAYYRMVGEGGYADALESGLIRPPVGSGHTEAYYNKGYPLDTRLRDATGRAGYGGPYMAEVKGNPELFVNENVANYTGPMFEDPVVYSKQNIPINNPNVKFYKEDWLRGYKEVPKPVAQGTANASPSNYFSDLIKSGQSYLKEKAGEKLAGAENRAAIAEGNKWSEDWASHPETARKIRQQIIDQKIFGNQNPAIFDRINTPQTREDYRYLTTYKPGATEFPLADQKKDLINTILGKNKYSTSMIHGDNLGVSYRHSRNPLLDMDDYIPGVRSSGPGTWISRTPSMNQAARKSVTVHENTHDWLRDDALERLGYKDEIQSHLSQEAMDASTKWIESGYNTKKHYLGYLADPTEVHARIMQTRNHFSLTPFDKVTPEMAETMLQVIREGKVPTVSKTFADIFSSPKGVAQLFNKLPALAPVAVGVGAAATALPKEQKNGGWLNKYK